MKAIVCKKSGKPDVLSLMEVDKPTPKENEMLVRVVASSVTRGDVHLRKMPRWLLHIVGLLFGFKPMIITGIEFSGIVELTGSKVTKFAIGDEVFGTTTGLTNGGNAEFVCVPEKWKMGVVVHKPQGVTFPHAAALPVGAMTAMDMFNRIEVKPNDKILVYGASGSVGSYAVQLAKSFGATVTAVCSTKNMELVKDLGADAVIDYTVNDFTKGNQKYDVIFDAVGKIWKHNCTAVLQPNGKFLTVRMPTKEKVENLQKISALAQEGKLKALIDKEYTLEHVPEAHRYVESGRKRGNVVVIIQNQNNS